MKIGAKKSLGQNFLTSKQALDRIIETGQITSQDIVLEVGPGKGALTAELLSVARQVIAVEKDERLIIHLSFKFKDAIDAGKLKLIVGDILEFDPSSENLQAGGYKIIANIPYYITGQFIRRFLSVVTPPSLAVLMLQKEVVERIVARSRGKDTKESILSISVKCFGRPRYIETVSKKYFSPEPRVDSAIILIDDISKKYFDDISEEKFFDAVKSGFSKKRKKLASNLTGIYVKEFVIKSLKEMGLSENTRAEDLSVQEWKTLVKRLG